MQEKQMKEQLLQEKTKSAVELPVDYWKIILNLLDECCEERMNEIKGAPQAYIFHLQATNPAELTRISGPLLARGLIVDKLVEDGLLRPEAKQAAGLDWVGGGIEKLSAKGMN